MLLLTPQTQPRSKTSVILFSFSHVSPLSSNAIQELFSVGLSIVNSALNPCYFPPIKKASFFVLNISIESISFFFFAISSLGPQIHHIRDNFDFISFSYFFFSSTNISKSQASCVCHLPTQSSYLSQICITNYICGEKNCHVEKFRLSMWRKIEPKSTFVEKK